MIIIVLLAALCWLALGALEVALDQCWWAKNFAGYKVKPIDWIGRYALVCLALGPLGLAAGLLYRWGVDHYVRR